MRRKGKVRRLAHPSLALFWTAWSPSWRAAYLRSISQGPMTLLISCEPLSSHGSIAPQLPHSCGAQGLSLAPQSLLSWLRHNPEEQETTLHQGPGMMGFSDEWPAPAVSPGQFWGMFPLVSQRLLHGLEFHSLTHVSLDFMPSLLASLTPPFNPGSAWGEF